MAGRSVPILFLLPDWGIRNSVYLIERRKDFATDAQVLSDDRPVFDKLNNKWNEEWRQLAIDNALTEVVKYKIPFFR